MLDVVVAGEKLAWMESSYDIAIFLQSQGVKGNRAQADNCAIANWVTDVSGRQVWVCDAGISVTGSISDTIVGASVPMKQFLRDFDSGHYLYLEVDNGLLNDMKGLHTC